MVDSTIILPTADGRSITLITDVTSAVHTIKLEGFVAPGPGVAPTLDFSVATNSQLLAVLEDF